MIMWYLPVADRVPALGDKGDTRHLSRHPCHMGDARLWHVGIGHFLNSGGCASLLPSLGVLLYQNCAEETPNRGLVGMSGIIMVVGQPYSFRLEMYVAVDFL
jgi:hypothetical protein